MIETKLKFIKKYIYKKKKNQEIISTTKYYRVEELVIWSLTKFQSTDDMLKYMMAKQILQPPITNERKRDSNQFNWMKFTKKSINDFDFLFAFFLFIFRIEWNKFRSVNEWE